MRSRIIFCLVLCSSCSYYDAMPAIDGGDPGPPLLDAAPDATDGCQNSADPRIGQPCNVGMTCQGGVFGCSNRSIVCQRIPNDLDLDGIPDGVDTDDDGDGILDTIDEFPRAIQTEVPIGFDNDGNGAPIPHDTLIKEQYANLGLHFGSGYHACRRTRVWPCYNTNASLNLLATIAGASGGGCTPPANQNLVIRLDAPVDFASIEMRTGCGGVDGDQGTLEVFDQNDQLLCTHTVSAHNGSDPAHEAKAIARCQVPGIRRIVIKPGGGDGFDSLDNLRLVKLTVPCGL